MLIIGRNVIAETLNNNPDVFREIYILQGLNDNKLNKIIVLAKTKNISVKFLGKEEFNRIFSDKDKSEGVSQGIAALTIEFEYSDLTEMIKKASIKEFSYFIMLDEIQDPHNLGAIIRTASASGTDGILISEKNSAKINHTVFKTSAGTVNFIDISLTGNVYKTIEMLKDAGYKIIGTDLKSDSDLFQFKFPSKICIILGNESEGLRTNIKRLCDLNIKIPLNNKKVDSLNVSVSAGIILYEIYRQLHYK